MAEIRKIEWLEAIRGLAAIWVLLSHSMLAVTGFVGNLGSGFNVLSNGYLGVDFFFILSGFIIAKSSERLYSFGKGIRDYLIARSIRIYVPYMPVGIVILMLYAMLPALSHGNRESLSIVTSLTLFPTNAPPALSVAWTLVHEIIFYALFSIYFVSRRALAIIIVLWGTCISIAWFTKIELSFFVNYFFSPLNLCFILGVVTFWLSRNGVKKSVGVSTLLVGIMLVGSQVGSIEPNRALVALGFTGMVIASMSSMLVAISPGRILTILGAASYSIYLVHNPLLSALVRIINSKYINPSIALIIISFGSLLIGLLYHFLYERRAILWVKERVRQSIERREGWKPVNS